MTQRRALAQRLEVKLLQGDSRESRVVEVRDHGTGLTPDQMPSTILSLNESNKIQKRHLAGAYGQGGSSTFAACHFSLIASRREGHPVGFTVVQFEEPPLDDPFKVGRYVYLVMDNRVLEADDQSIAFEQGTLVKHVGYDLSVYGSPLGPNSLYGLLNQTLFDPVMPAWFDNRVHDYRRVIKGTRNALNGAADDEEERKRGPSLAHRVPMFFVSLGDLGRIGVEYWVLAAASKENKRPSAAFVNPSKPIVLTLNGQNQAELSQIVVRKEAELPYLAQRFICHVDCNALSPSALRALFVSNREDARRGFVYDMIREELVRIFKSDDDLKRLNAEAKEHTLKNRDEDAAKQMRKEVARLLRLQGLSVVAPSGGVGTGGDEPAPPPKPRPPRPPVVPIEIHEPPTYIRVVWDEGEEIPFHSEQRRYIRIETDANSNYHDPKLPHQSRVNVIVSNAEVAFRGSTPLSGGRMRAIFDCVQGASVGGTGTLRVELMRVGQPLLHDERPIRIVEPPPPQVSKGRVEVPPFEWIRVDGPDDDTWSTLGWPDDVDAVASSALMEDGVLTIYWSAVFPKLATRVSALEGRDPSLAASFLERYKVWLAVHSLILYNDQQSVEGKEELNADSDTDADEAIERVERRRVAAMSVLVAARETEYAASEPAGLE